MTERFSLSWRAGCLDEGKLVREFLREKEISKSALSDIKFQGGRISVNGVETTVRYSLQEGDKVQVDFPVEEPSPGLVAEDLELDIVFEDEYVLVVNKPAGMSTIPSREHPAGSLANALAGYYRRKGIYSTIHVMTRLDRDTSGLVLIAKHRHVHHLLTLQRKKGLLSRVYEAFASGHFKEDLGKIELPIARKADSIIEREVSIEGQFACTFFQVVKRLGNFTRLELRLETGRTHQIRVHMSALGHPLLGDDLYGGDTLIIKRQALHCKHLQFSHPISGAEIRLDAKLPDDMKVLL